MSVPLGILITVVFVLGFALVNALEISVVASNRIRVRHLAESGSKSAQALDGLLQNQDRFFAATVLLQNILVVAAGAVGGSIGNAISDSFAVVVAATIITALFTAEFGELIPKVLASRAGESLALPFAIPAVALTRVLTPVNQVIGFIPSLLSRWLFGVNLETGPTVTEAELRMLIESSADSGQVDEAEAELLDRVFHFGDRRVHEVMVPRTEVVWLPRASSVSDFYRVYSLAPHSRFPVYDESPDHVTGILGIKDVLAALAAGLIKDTNPVQPLVRDAYFVPETKLIGELFREMQSSGTQMAIAIDEFGGTAGIVTLEQLLEEMVGPVWDELRPEDPEIKEIDEFTTEIDGGLSVTEAREELGVPIPDGEYDTVAGFVLSELGHIPNEGEQVLLDEYRITVLEMKGPKIELLRLTKTA